MANQNFYKVFFHKILCKGEIENSRNIFGIKNILNHTILLIDNCYYCSFYKVYILYV